MIRRILITIVLCSVAISALPVGQHAIGQKDKTFSSAALTVKAGDSIIFKNDDEVTHNVFSNSSGNEFNLKTQAPGATSTVTMKTAGTVEVRCAFHPKMKLTVTVK